MAAPIYAKMARRQLRLTIFGGFALVPVFGIGIAVATSHPTGTTTWAKAGDIVWSAVAVCLSIAGISALPAFLAGLLRLWPMARLFAIRQGYGTFSQVLVLGGTLLLFEATVLLGALLLYAVDYRVAYQALWNICAGLSLPWLLASLWASWRVMHEASAGEQFH